MFAAALVPNLGSYVKAWYMRQSKVGVVNKDYTAQKSSSPNWTKAIYLLP